MIHLFIQIGNFFQELIQSIVSLAKVLVYSKFNIKLSPSNKTRASILGNGPSLKTSLEKDLDFIQSTEIYCVNMFAFSESYTQIKPANYVLLDPAFFLYSPANDGRKDVAELITKLVKNTSWTLNLFIPQRYKNSFFASEMAKNPNIRFIFFNYTIVRGFRWFRYLMYNSNLGMVQSQNILICSLFLSLRRGHQEIYLFGADHSWHEEIRVDENNDLALKQVHFYDNPDKVQHKKVLDVTTNKHSNLHEIFLSLHKVFYSYLVLAEYAQNLGIKVKNKSVKSYIDAFERV